LSDTLFGKLTLCLDKQASTKPLPAFGTKHLWIYRFLQYQWSQADIYRVMKTGNSVFYNKWFEKGSILGHILECQSKMYTRLSNYNGFMKYLTHSILVNIYRVKERRSWIMNKWHIHNLPTLFHW